MSRSKRKCSIDNLSKCVFYYKYRANDANDDNDCCRSCINVLVVNVYLAIKKSHEENDREQVIASKAEKKKEKKKRLTVL